jgi:small membrane protein
MWFQIVLVIALVATAVYLLRSTPTAKHLAVRRLVVFLGLAAGVVVVLAPGVLTRMANAVGIGRGADLLFYLAIVAGLAYVVNEYKRSVQLARANTQLARDLALTEARLHDRIAELERKDQS